MGENKWINSSTDRYSLRDTLFNRSVAIMPKSLDSMAEGFDSLFSNITSYLDEISSVKLYPFPVVDSSVNVGQLTTTKGTDSGVWVANLGTNTRIFNLGYVYMSMPTFEYYAPYSKYVLWLPWFSFVDIDPTKVANRYLLVRLSVDYHTGQGQYILSTSVKAPTNNSFYYTADSNAEKVIATYTFNLGIDIPLGESNASDLTRNAVLGAVKASVGIATGLSLASAPVSASVTTSSVENISKGFSRGDYKGARMLQRSESVDTSQSTTTNEQYVNPTREISSSVSSGLATLAYNNASGSGDRSNQPMLLWDMPTYPRMLVYRARISPLSDTFAKLNGSPLAFDCKLSSVGGYAKISNVHIEGIGATESEIKQIQSLLYQGVILPQAETQTLTIDDLSYTVGKNWNLDMVYRYKAYNSWHIDNYCRIYNKSTGYILTVDDEICYSYDNIDWTGEYSWSSDITLTII